MVYRGTLAVTLLSVNRFIFTSSACQAQAAQAKYAGQVAQEQADAATEAGKIAEENQRDQDRRLRAAQRARIGATGAEEAVGAALLAEMESTANAEFNARAIREVTNTNPSNRLIH